MKNSVWKHGWNLLRGSALACAAWAMLAPASRADSLSFSDHSKYPGAFAFSLYGHNYDASGGSITDTTLNIGGTTYHPQDVYCIAATVDIQVRGNYDVTVSTTGDYNGKLMNNPGSIAWLVDNLASSATTDVQQQALQAAIWTEVYGAANFVLNTRKNSNTLISDYNNDMQKLASNVAPIDTLYWLTPYRVTHQDHHEHTTIYQGLVTLNPNAIVPEPSSIILGLIGLTGPVGLALLRRKAAA